MSNPTAHPARDAFLRLVLLLAFYGVAILVGLLAVGFLLIFAGSFGGRLATALGGSFLAKVAGFCVTFLLLLVLEVFAGAAVGVAYGLAMTRWPDNPVEKLVKWVKSGS